MIPPAIILVAGLFVGALGAEIVTRRDYKKLLNAHVELSQHNDRLQKQNGEILHKYFNDESGDVFENVPQWNAAEAAALEAFLKTDAGRVLEKRFRAVACNTALEGCKDEMHTTYAAGNANGWNEACQWFLKLSRVTGDQVTNHDEQVPEDEARLLERFSS